MSLSNLLQINEEKDTLEESANRPRVEPRFFKKHQGPPSQLKKIAPTFFAYKPERLLPVSAQSLPPHMHVKGTSRPLIRKEIYADPSLAGYFAASLITHFIIIFALTYHSSHNQKAGSPQAQNNTPVEMIFSQPPATSGMVGPQSPTAGSGNQAPTESTTNKPTSPSQTPTPPTPATTPQESQNAKDQTAEDGIVPPQPQNPSSAPPLKVKHGKNKPQKQPSQNDTALLEHPQEYSLNQAPAPTRPQHTRPGGSTSPVDLSIGPVVQNGKINAHFASRSAVHGVSSDYAAEIDKWIRDHLYYPPDAAERGEEGDSSVHVVLDRSGQVLRVWQVKSATESLDTATIGMFNNAKLPPVPPDMKDKYIDVDVTVDYILVRE